jgi:hypothetical protein
VLADHFRAQNICVLNHLTIYTFRNLAHGVEHRPHRPVVGEPVAAAALVPGLPHPLPAPKDTVAPANDNSNSVVTTKQPSLPWQNNLHSHGRLASGIDACFRHQTMPARGAASDGRRWRCRRRCASRTIRSWVCTCRSGRR